MEEAIQYACLKVGYSELKPFQKTVLKDLGKGMDSFVCVPTGAGKSVLFECAPFMSHFLLTDGKPDTRNVDRIALVISPLVSLMRTQCSELVDRGISAAYLSDISADTQKEAGCATLDKVCWL